MAKILKCRDVGVDCDHVIRGVNEQEIMEKAKQHAAKDHAIHSIPRDLLRRVKAAIHDANGALGANEAATAHH
jgi:predicted small metal-binding protein